MVKLKLWVFTVFAVLCLCLIAAPGQSEPPSLAPSLQAVARNVLVEAGIPRQYDLYLRNAIELGTLPHHSERFIAWLHNLTIREAGWKTVEAEYLKRMEARFTLDEMVQLQAIFKQPLMKKLLETEVQGYASTSKQRRQSLAKLWDNYQTGVYSPPPGIQ